eukprot:TRINITY_DN2008_c1_g1_i1.p1 TRINITY_DN2008_c1_g1~~TRINITY_DN2008_c1_g1_i1.p1  ORF type:complete len:294 (-),score=34.44 TRINITY_DN2008_c1_g1_i1:290-1054(-)
MDKQGVIIDFTSFGVNPLEQYIRKTHGAYKQSYMVQWKYAAGPEMVRDCESYMLVDERILRFITTSLKNPYMPDYDTIWTDYNICPGLHPAFNPTVKEYLVRKGQQHELEDLKARGLMMEMDQHRGTFVQFSNLPRAVTEEQLLRWLGDGKDALLDGSLIIKGERGYNVAYFMANSEAGQDRCLMNYDKERVFAELQQQSIYKDDIQLQDDLVDRQIALLPSDRIFLPVGLDLPPAWQSNVKQIEETSTASQDE